MENNETERKTSPISLTKYLPLPTDQIQTFEILTNTQIGLLIRLISKYYLGEKSFEEIKSEISNEDIIILPILINIKINIERAEEKYNKKREQNRENGKKGGAPKGNQNARKKKDNIKDKEEHAPQTKETEEDNAAEEDENSLSDEEIKLLSEKAQNMVKRMETELSVYNTSLFKHFTKKQAIKFLSYFITGYDMDYIFYSDNISFDLWYNNGALGFLNDFKDYYGSDPTKFLKEFEKATKESYLDESDRATIDGYYQDLKINERILTNVIDKILNE